MFFSKDIALAIFLVIFLNSFNSSSAHEVECMDFESLQTHAFSNLLSHLPSVMAANHTTNVTQLNTTHVADVIALMEMAVACEDDDCRVRAFSAQLNHRLILLFSFDFSVSVPNSSQAMSSQQQTTSSSFLSPSFATRTTRMRRAMTSWRMATLQ